MNIDGVIFDLDGTLWDSTEVLAKAWTSVIKDYKVFDSIITKEDVKSCMGLAIKDILRELFSNLKNQDENILMEKICIRQREYLSKEGGILYENLEKTLLFLSNKYPIFIVSNCQSDYIETFLKYHELGRYIKDIECEGNTGFTKEKNIQIITERNNLRKPVYIGDTQGDFNAATDANVPFIYAKYGFGKVENFDNSINSLVELVELLN